MRRIAAFGAAFFALVISLPAHAENGHPVYVFGDSLSDVGNLFAKSGGAVPPPTRYFQGRFSNGPVWVEYFAEELGAPPPQASALGFEISAGDSVVFAHGGAGTGMSNTTPDGFFNVPGVLGQVELFRQALSAEGRMAPSEALYVIWGGANDFLFLGTLNPRTTVENIRQAIESLYALGARRFLIPNLPDLGEVPVVAEASLGDTLSAITRAQGGLLTSLPGVLGGSQLLEPLGILGDRRAFLPDLPDVPDLADLLTGSVNTGLIASTLLSTQSRVHNSLLAATLRRLERTMPDATFASYDVYALVESILEDPAAYGFTSGSAPGPAAGCVLPPMDCSPVDLEPTGSPLFWDEVHPSTNAHQIIGEEAIWALPERWLEEEAAAEPLRESLLRSVGGLLDRLLGGRQIAGPGWLQARAGLAGADWPGSAAR